MALSSNYPWRNLVAFEVTGFFIRRLLRWWEQTIQFELRRNSSYLSSNQRAFIVSGLPSFPNNKETALDSPSGNSRPELVCGWDGAESAFLIGRMLWIEFLRVSHAFTLVSEITYVLAESFATSRVGRLKNTAAKCRNLSNTIASCVYSFH